MSRSITDDELSELVSALRGLDDPRVKGRCTHTMIDILVLTVCAVLCGADSIIDIEEFGKQKLDWLSRYLELENGVPSHDTIGRVLSLVDSDQLEKLFNDWVQSTIQGKLNLISLDGKSSKGTDRRFNGNTRPLHVVSAFSHEHGLSLCQSASKSSGLAEGEAAMECIKMLDLRGVTVLADAGIGQKKIIKEIRNKNGHYVVPIKSNNRQCFAELNEIFSEFAGKTATTIDKGHGRKERRKCRLLSVQKMSDRFKDKWTDSKTIFSISRKRYEKDNRYNIQRTGQDGKQTYSVNENKGKIRETESITYYVSSKKLTTQQALNEVRTHWGIENRLHWVLDVVFKEDDWTVRSKKVARNLSSIRRMTLNMIRNDKSEGSVRIKRKRAGWNDNFLQKLVFGDQI